MFANLCRKAITVYAKHTTTLIPMTGNAIESTARFGIGSILSRSMHILSGAKSAVNIQLMNVPKLLTPTASPQLMQTCGFKVKYKVKRRCRDCYMVMRQGRMYNICPTHPRHKQMAIKVHPRINWIITHATQSKIRPW